MIKLKLKLHQPKKWVKNNYVSQDDIDQFEYLIYNDLDITKKIQRDIPTYNFNWVDKHLVDDEEYAPLGDPLNMYCITSYGRIFSNRGKKMIKPIKIVNNFYITLKGTTVTYRKEFLNNDWAYSSFNIVNNYNKYGWSYLKSKSDK